jgi:fimbrial chaperone protein
MQRMSCLRFVCVAASVVCIPLCAGAQALEVQPIAVEFPPGQTASSITVTNRGSTVANLQIRAFGWTQEATSTMLSANSSLAFSPPFATIPPSGKQVIRVVLQQPPVGAEASYQLFLDELATPMKTNGVSLAFRVKIPVFAESDKFAAAKIVWQLVSAGGQATLTATNQGSKHLRVGILTLTSASGRQFKLPTNGSFYVLPGVARSWSITGAAASMLSPGAKVDLTASGEYGPLNTTLIVSGAS